MWGLPQSTLLKVKERYEATGKLNPPIEDNSALSEEVATRHTATRKRLQKETGVPYDLSKIPF